MMFSEPVTMVAEAVGQPRQFDRIAQGVGRVEPGWDGRLVNNRELQWRPEPSVPEFPQDNGTIRRPLVRIARHYAGVIRGRPFRPGQRNLMNE
jgi:hypothetical protein